MSDCRRVQDILDKKLEEYKSARDEADDFDGAILSVMIAVIVDLKNELGLD